MKMEKKKKQWIKPLIKHIEIKEHEWRVYSGCSGTSGALMSPGSCC